MRFTEIFYKIDNNQLFEKLNKKKFKIQSLEDFLDEEGIEPLEEAKLGSDFKFQDYPEDMLRADLKQSIDNVENKKIVKKLKKGKIDKSGFDKFNKPRIHSSTAKQVRITDMNGSEFDLDKLRKLITTPPRQMLKANKKMKNSIGENVRFYNLGLPAIKGLLFDEDDKKFKIISTCPNAGVCKLYCYAHKGGYVQFQNASLAPTKLLNLLMNHPDKFEEMLSAELTKALRSAKKDGTQVILRWHDSGDFFSDAYKEIAFSIAKKFPEIRFYAYTKDAGIVNGQKPENFVFNFSFGAMPSQERKVNDETKVADVIKKDEFLDFVIIDGKGNLVKDNRGKMQYKSQTALKEFKEKMAVKNNLKIENILTYDELMKKSEGESLKWSVIVAAGDGDDAAMRKDVKNIFLLIH